MEKVQPQSPSQRANRTDRWSETMLRALTSRVNNRWRLVSFRGTNGGEWCGVVDVVAIRKNTSDPGKEPLKRGDIFELILVQMKGGWAKDPTAHDLDRLDAVKEYYRAKEVVLFERRDGVCHFSKLRGREWEKSSVQKIFGRDNKKSLLPTREDESDGED